MTLIFKDQKSAVQMLDNKSTLVTKNGTIEDFNTIKLTENDNEHFNTFKYNEESLSSSFGTMIIKDDFPDQKNTLDGALLSNALSAQHKEQMFSNYEPKTLLDTLDGQDEMNKARNLIRNEVKCFENTAATPGEKKNNFLFNLTYLDMQLRLKYVDMQMEEEIQALKQKFEQKRQVILEAVELKKKNSSNIF